MFGIGLMNLYFVHFYFTKNCKQYYQCDQCEMMVLPIGLIIKSL